MGSWEGAGSACHGSYWDFPSGCFSFAREQHSCLSCGPAIAKTDSAAEGDGFFFVVLFGDFLLKFFFFRGRREGMSFETAPHD